METKAKHVWAALDQIAEEAGLTASGLAVRSGLDATSYNVSKRKSPTKQWRWPNTGSISKTLNVTGKDWRQFGAMIEEQKE